MFRQLPNCLIQLECDDCGYREVLEYFSRTDVATAKSDLPKAAERPWKLYVPGMKVDHTNADVDSVWLHCGCCCIGG